MVYRAILRFENPKTLSGFPQSGKISDLAAASEKSRREKANKEHGGCEETGSADYQAAAQPPPAYSSSPAAAAINDTSRMTPPARSLVALLRVRDVQDNRPLQAANRRSISSLPQRFV